MGEPNSSLTAKGQTTIPKEIRDFLHLSTGDRLFWRKTTEGEVRVTVRGKSAKDIRGILKPCTKVKSTAEDMNKAVKASFEKGKR
jgi:AbrB family looped-hinge helix DNA binding protein